MASEPSERYFGGACWHEWGIRPETREMILSSYCSAFPRDEEGEEPGVDNFMATKFLLGIRELDAYGDDPILIHQMSMGGEWEYGMAIYHAIKSCRSYVAILCHAWARSMSSIIPQAADLRVIMPDAKFMFHRGTVSFPEDQALGFYTYAEENKEAEERMLDIYVERCRSSEASHFRKKRWSRERIKTYLKTKMNLKQEVWLSAEDAVAWGFMDRVLDDSIEALLAELNGS